MKKIDNQEDLREGVRRIKWEDDISYKVIAEDLLEMNYNSFLNWLHQYKSLGKERAEKLRDYLNCMID